MGDIAQRGNKLTFAKGGRAGYALGGSIVKKAARHLRPGVFKKGIRSSNTGAISSVKPGGGGLKKSREMFESLQESSATGVKRFGRPHTTHVISKQGVKKGFPGITKQAGDIERSRKQIIKKHPHMAKQLKKVKLDR